MKLKDPVSGLTHLVGALLSIAALVLLVVWAALYSNEKPWDIVSFAIFGSSLILLYTFSTLYHLCNVSEHASTVLRKFDHIMIFILIAGTYTPICLGPLRGGWGWTIFGIVWGIAIVGTVISAIWIKAPRWLTTSLYLGMGWAVIIATYPLIQTFINAGMFSGLGWLLAGGLFYTIGAVIYGVKKPNLNIPGVGFHEIFHIFVMLGSLCHFWFIFKFVLHI